MRSKRFLLAFSCAVLPGLVGSCAQSRVAEHFGEAQRGNVAHMVEHPEAEQAPPAAVEGLDPITGRAVIGTYEREQSAPREASRLPSIIEFSTGSER